ncbi:MAG: Mur ligase family protein [Candidatus Pacearchaeota archaeon]
MKFDYETLLKIWPSAVFINFNQNVQFDHINMATLPGDIVSDELHHLFFALSDLKPEVNGWYDKPFDRKSYFPNITFDKPHWSFVINEHTDLQLLNPSVKVIVVPSVTQACKELLNYTLELIKPQVCAVTGSVGKTTTVGLIEQILLIKYNCIRLYTKRISPPILCMMIVNKIASNTQFIVLEMAMWRWDHIQVLARLLPPTIGVILNIKPVHIGVQGINSVQDILESKSQITNGAISVINIDDKLLLDKYIDQANIVSFAINNKSADVYVDKINVDKNEVLINIRGSKISFKPFLLTKLTMYQVLAACCVGVITGITVSEIAKHISSLEPKENRLVRTKLKNYNILFDGERTLDERINELAENLYEDTTLIIFRFEDKYPLDLQVFPLIFSKFTRVHILDDFTNREQLSLLAFSQNTKFVDHVDVLNNVPENSMIFLHYSTYYRFDELKYKDPILLLEH